MSHACQASGHAPQITRSIPDVPLVEFDLVPQEELFEFVLKRDLR